MVMNVTGFTKGATSFDAYRQFDELGMKKSNSADDVKIPDYLDELPETLVPLFSHFVLEESLDLGSNVREHGNYQLKSARGLLRQRYEGHPEAVLLKITATSLPDLRQLYQAIIGGTIRPVANLHSPQITTSS